MGCSLSIPASGCHIFKPCASNRSFNVVGVAVSLGLGETLGKGIDVGNALGKAANVHEIRGVSRVGAAGNEQPLRAKNIIAIKKNRRGN